MLSIRSLGKRYPGGTVGLADFSLEVGEGVLAYTLMFLGIGAVLVAATAGPERFGESFS